MTIAIDLGSSEFRSLRKNQERLIARRVPAVYCAVENRTESRDRLEQARIPFSQTEDSLIVVGSAAVQFTQLVGHPLIPAGFVLSRDPVGRQVCAALIEAILPRSETRDEACGICMPAISTRNRLGGELIYTNLLALHGYRAYPLNPATAVAFSELDQDGLTGLAIVVGAESMSISLTDLGRVVFELNYARGFQQILKRFAAKFHHVRWDQQSRQFYDLPGVERWLIDNEIALHAPRTDSERWLTNQVRSLLHDAWMSTLTVRFRRGHDTALKKRLPVVLAGGPTNLPGFTELVYDVLQNATAGISIESIRPSIFTPFAVCRGLLIHAELQSGLSVTDLTAA